ncbi:MAG: Fibronectin type domain protein, partial [Bacteroidetes bacterium]|nr:Fibronectin type domain protein [Bacteroidota bacterium]
MIVDNDKSSVDCSFRATTGVFHWHQGVGSGFANFKDTYPDGENPFKTGTFIQANTVDNEDNPSTAEWTYSVPETGSYAVYISYKTLPNSCSEAIYTVYHAGGETNFGVNQTMGGGTWIYLGNFVFAKNDPQHSKVVLTNRSTDINKLVTADAVKIRSLKYALKVKRKKGEKDTEQKPLPPFSISTTTAPAVCHDLPKEPDT